MAYPVYITIGNIPKEIRRKPSHRAQILIAYFPTSKLEHIESKTVRRRALGNLFHACMERVLGPIALHGEVGIPMAGGDGVWRRCHPIFATFVGDYPEQTLVTCTYKGRCPKCLVRPDQLGQLHCFPLRDYNNTIETYLLEEGDVHPFHAACHDKGLKPIFHPFWESLLLVDIFLSITPDVLHQLLQGVIKHLVSWVTSPLAFGPARIDARCRTIPPNHHITLFPKGISSLSRVTGKEYKGICCILLGLLVDLPLPHGQVPTRLLRAVRALLDFVYLAQFQCQTTDTIGRLDECLTRFHENKAVFMDLGIRDHFNIPKFHSLLHYSSSIALFGTTDNYNTEQTERLHIDFTKKAYCATNYKDELPQMTTWLARQEKIQQHMVLIKRLQERNQPPTVSRNVIGPQATPRNLKMAQHPSVKAVSFADLSMKYGAMDFQDALADYIVSVNYPGLSTAMLRAHSGDTSIPFQTVPVFHKVKFTAAGTSDIIDSVLVRLKQTDGHGRVIPPRFDTILVRGRQLNSIHGKHGGFQSYLQV